MDNEKKKIVCGVVLRENDKFLLVQEKKKSAFGLCNLPAGHVEPRETFEQAVKREAKEEVGYDIVVEVEIGVFNEPNEPVEKHSFEAKIIGGVLHFPEDELLDARWFTLDEIKVLAKEGKLRGEWALQSIEMILDKEIRESREFDNLK